MGNEDDDVFFSGGLLGNYRLDRIHIARIQKVVLSSNCCTCKKSR